MPIGVASSRRTTMVEERDPPQGGSEMGSELDDLEGMAANWAQYS